MHIFHHANSYDTVNHALLLAGAIRQRMCHLLDQAPSLQGCTELAIYGCGLSGQIARFALRPKFKVPKLFDQDPAWSGKSLFDTRLESPERISELGGAPLLVATSPAYNADIEAKVRALPGGRDIPLAFLFADEPDARRVEWNPQSRTGHFNLPYDSLDSIMEQAIRFIPYLDPGQDTRVAIYGCGMAGILALHACRIPRIPIRAFYDRNRKLHGQSYLGVPIRGLDAATAEETTDLLVALSAPHAKGLLGQLRRTGPSLRALQCLFPPPGPAPDEFILHGYTLEGGLGGGSEGLVYLARRNGGRHVLKQFKQPSTTPGLDRFERTHRRNTLGLPQGRVLRDGNGQTVAYAAPYQPSRNILQTLIQGDSLRPSMAAYYLRMQRHLAAGSRLHYVDRISHYNYRLRPDGRPLVVDLGKALVPLEDIQPLRVQRNVVNALAALLPGKRHGFLDRNILAPDWADRVLAHARAVLPPGHAWFLGLLLELCALAPEDLLHPGAYDRVLRKAGLAGCTKAPADILPMCDATPPPGLEVLRDGEPWFREKDYQEFHYAPGRLEPFGETQRKLEGLPYFAEGFAGRSYLDLGCDTGFFVTLASLRGAGAAMGLDVSGHSVLKCRQIADIVNPGADCRFVEGRAPGHRFDRKFDVVSAFSLIHHLYQDKAQFPGLRDVLSYLASLCTEAVIVEFVSVEDGNAYEYPSLAGDPDYNETAFVNALSSLFCTVRCANNMHATYKKVYLGQGLRRP